MEGSPRDGLDFLIDSSDSSLSTSTQQNIIRKTAGGCNLYKKRMNESPFGLPVGVPPLQWEAQQHFGTNTALSSLSLSLSLSTRWSSNATHSYCHVIPQLAANMTMTIIMYVIVDI